MAQKLRIAAVGLGWVALHRHIPSILRRPDLELVGVIDRHAGLAEKVARKHSLSFFAQTDTLDNVPWMDQVDAITIGAPPMSHASLALSAFQMGKHVLTEKPFAMSLDEASAMGDSATKAGKTLAIVHNFQFSRAARKLQSDIQNGKLGKLRGLAATQLGNPLRRLPVWYEKLPLGLFYDESPHFFYLLHGLAQGALKLEKAEALGQQGHETPRLVHLLYRDEGGMPVSIDCQFDSAVSEWFIRVTGEKAVAFIDIFRDIYIRLPNDGAHGAFDILKTTLYTIGQHIWQHIPNGFSLVRGTLDYGNDEIIGRFARAIQTGLAPEQIGFAEAFAVLKLQHEAIKALKENWIP